MNMYFSWDVHGIINIDYLEEGWTINGNYYGSLLDHLRKEIGKDHIYPIRECSAMKSMHLLSFDAKNWIEDGTVLSVLELAHRIFPPETFYIYYLEKWFAREKNYRRKIK